MTADFLIQTALDCGATKAAIIDQEQIVVSAYFRELCAQNTCGNYGRCWMCPPDVGEIESMMESVRRFPRALFYQTVSQIEDSFDIEGMQDASRNHVQVSQRIQAAHGLTGPTLHLTCGGCHLCEVCAKHTGEPCRHPDRALASLESCGVDVYNTSRSTDLKYINGQNTVTYFGMLLFSEENHA